MNVSLIINILKELGIGIKLTPKTLVVIKDGVKVFIGVSKGGKLSPNCISYLCQILGIKI